MPFDSDMEARIAKAMAAEEAKLRKEAYLSGNWDLKAQSFLYKDARRIQRAWRRKWGLISRGRSVNPVQKVIRGFLGRRKAERRRVELETIAHEELLRRCRPRLVKSAQGAIGMRPWEGGKAVPRSRIRKRPFSREHYPRVPEETMFHDLRTFFDAEYRLHMVRLELRKLLAKTKLSLSDLFDKVDVDGSMVINRDELKALIELAGCHVKDMEVDFLMSKIDGDGSGEIDLSELSTWYYSNEDDKLMGRRTRYDDDFTDKRILQRESLRFHPEVQGLMDDLWVMTDLDDSGSINKQEYVILHVQLQTYMLPKGEFQDTKKARKLAEAEWEFDRHGKDEMDKRLFDLAMFQLVDLWRESGKINNDTFFEAIDAMHMQTTYINPDGSRRWRWINEDGTGNSSVQKLKEEMMMEAMIGRINMQILRAHEPKPPPPRDLTSPVNRLLDQVGGDGSAPAHQPPNPQMSAEEAAWRRMEASADDVAAELERALEQEQLEFEAEEKQAREDRERERAEQEEARRILDEQLEREYEAMKWDGSLAKFKLTGPIMTSLHDVAVSVADTTLDVFRTGMNFHLCEHIGDIIREEFPRLCKRPLMAFHRPEVLMEPEIEEEEEQEGEVPESEEQTPEVKEEPSGPTEMELAMMRLAMKEKEERAEREQRELDLRLMRKEDELSRKAFRPKKTSKKIERHKTGFTTVLKADNDGNVIAFDIPSDVPSKDLEPLGTPSSAKPMPRVALDKSHQEYTMRDWGKRPDTTTMGKAEQQQSAMSFGPKTYPKGTTRDGVLATRESRTPPRIGEYQIDTGGAADRRRADEGAPFSLPAIHRKSDVFTLRSELSQSLSLDGDMSGWGGERTSSPDDNGRSLTSFLGVSESLGELPSSNTGSHAGSNSSSRASSKEKQRKGSRERKNRRGGGRGSR